MTSLKKEDDRDKPEAAEIGMIILSVAVTLGLFGYVGYQAATSPTGPDLSVKVERIETEGSDVHVHLMVRNDGGTGVRSATVEVPCDDPPPQLSFDHLPANGQRRGVVVCSAAEDLEPEIASWSKV